MSAASADDVHPRWVRAFHPGFRHERSCWAWTDDGLLLERHTVHPVREVQHEVMAFVTGTGITVAHRSGPAEGSLPPFVGALDVAVDAQLGPKSQLRRRVLLGPLALEVDERISVAAAMAQGAVTCQGTASPFTDATAVVRQSTGIAPLDLPLPPLSRPPHPLPQRLWFQALAPTEHGAVWAISIVENAAGERLHAEVLHATASPGPPSAVGALTLDWAPATRRLARATVADVGARGAAVAFTPARTLPTAFAGGLGGDWPVGGWVGDAAAACRHLPVDVSPPGLAGVEHVHLCEVEGLPGCTHAVVEVTALGPHEPSGLSGWTDPA